MTTFSFRAECAADVEKFRDGCDLALLGVRWMQFPDAVFPDVEVEIDTDATLAELQQIVREVPDGRIMLQTLRECVLRDNHLRRDWTIQP